jgi:hypothetical protein
MSSKHTQPKRTTIYISEQKHREAKAQASLKGMSISEYIVALIDQDLRK